MIDRRLLFALILLLILLWAGACLPRTIGETPPLRVRPAGFLAGIWHGIVAPLSLLVSLFRHQPLYQAYNTGFWYNLGYFLGIAGIFGGGVSVIRGKGK
jgi:ABC-type multidrug transport system permease subunit